jgi:hypothetical protein
MLSAAAAPARRLEFIPLGKFHLIWNGFRQLQGAGSTGLFGSVRFTLSSRDAWKASGYATNYLAKVPDFGFPESRPRAL